MDQKQKLTQHRMDFGIVKAIPCTPQGNEHFRKMVANGQPLPEDVYQEDGEYDVEEATFYRVPEPEMSKDELFEMLTYKQLKLLTTIRNCVLFFTILTILSLAAGLIAVLASM